jgi:hypothetical protein
MLFGESERGPMTRWLSSRRRALQPATAIAVLTLIPIASVIAVSSAGEPAAATGLALCGNAGPAPAIKHVLVVVLENESKRHVIGNSTQAPYMNGTLAAQCPTAASMFGATHWSAANYLALTAGQYPANSAAGCASVTACSTSVDNVFNQLSVKGLSWKAYEESMPSACDKNVTSGYYKLGHNPPPFYTNLASTCAQYDVPVPDLTAQSGAFWTDLQNGTLPTFAFISPNTVHDGQDGGTQGLPAIDAFLSSFVPLVAQSPSYQAGDTAMLVTFDEGSGADAKQGEDCLNQSLDTAGQQESCHLPFFVVYPYGRAGEVSGFFTHYSVTRAVEELFGLPLLAGAQTAASLVGPFLPPQPTTSPTEYVVNKGFEGGGKNGWGGVYTANSITTVVTEAAFTGTHSLRISSSATTAKAAGVTSKPPVIASSVAGTKLTGSVWVKANVSGLNLTLVIWETNPDGTSVASLSKAITLGDTAWHRIKNGSPYVVKQSGDMVNVSVYANSLPVGQAFYADAFSLTSP